MTAFFPELHPHSDESAKNGSVTAARIRIRPVVDHFWFARHSPATDSSSTHESCILGIVIELLRIDRGGWVALFPGNRSTYGFVDIH
jgi:hypothetical protein